MFISSRSCGPGVKNEAGVQTAGVHLLLVPLCLVYLQSNLVKVRTNNGKSNRIWIPFVGKELIFDVEYGNKHDSHSIVGVNDGFVVGHVTILSPGTTGAIGNKPVHVYMERCHDLHCYLVII